MTEDETVGWHHRLNGHVFEQTLGDTEGQGSLACCSPRGGKESDMTEQLTRRRQWHPTPVLLPGKIPWTEEPGELQSMGSLGVGHD